MANIPLLKAEVLGDPLEIGYASMSAQEVYDSLYTENRERQRATVKTYELVEATVQIEFTANVDTAQKEQRYWGIMGLGEINVSNTNVKDFLWGLFPPGSQTRANFVALSTETVSRVVELGLGDVKVGHIEAVRS